jgi:chromosome segregation ATPase
MTQRKSAKGNRPGYVECAVKAEPTVTIPREELTKLKAELDQASEWRMDIRKQVTQADAVAKDWKAKADELTVENNSLRAQLHEALLTAERMRGYMDAVEDGRPPEMVPAQRERQFGRYTASDQERTGSLISWAPTAKRWFER